MLMAHSMLAPLSCSLGHNMPGEVGSTAVAKTKWMLALDKLNADDVIFSPLSCSLWNNNLGGATKKSIKAAWSKAAGRKSSGLVL